jgi:hypothetical protein
MGLVDMPAFNVGGACRLERAHIERRKRFPKRPPSRWQKGMPIIALVHEVLVFKNQDKQPGAAPWQWSLRGKDLDRP